MRRLLPTPAQRAVEDVYDDLVLPAGRGGRASVHLGMVMSADGAATVAGRTASLGGAADQAAFGALRAAADAVLVGAGTVRAENYGPAAGPQARRERRARKGLAPSPRLVVVTGSLSLDPAARVFADPRHPPLLVTTSAAVERRGSEFEEVAEIVTVGDAEVDLGAALAVLDRRGLHRVLCEGGPTLNAALVAADLVDGLCLTVAPVLVAGAAPRIVAGEPDVEASRGLRLEEVWEHESELLLRYGR